MHLKWTYVQSGVCFNLVAGLYLIHDIDGNRLNVSMVFYSEGRVGEPSGWRITSGTITSFVFDPNRENTCRCIKVEARHRANGVWLIRESAAAAALKSHALRYSCCISQSKQKASIKGSFKELSAWPLGMKGGKTAREDRREGFYNSQCNNENSKWNFKMEFSL